MLYSIRFINNFQFQGLIIMNCSFGWWVFFIKTLQILLSLVQLSLESEQIFSFISIVQYNSSLFTLYNIYKKDSNLTTVMKTYLCFLIFVTLISVNSGRYYQTHQGKYFDYLLDWVFNFTFQDYISIIWNDFRYLKF